MNWQGRISADSRVMVGKPVIKGTRITVEFIIYLLSGGWSHEDILRNYPHLTEEDIRASLGCAHALIEGMRGLPIE